MKKIIISIITATILIGALITVHLTKASAEQPRQPHSTIMLGYRPTYRLVERPSGNYMTENDYVVDLVSSSANAPDIHLGDRYAVVNAFLRDEGYHVAGQLPYGLEKWEK